MLLRGSRRILVDTAEDMTACAEATTGRQAVELTEHHRPDVVLMDIRMPATDGVAATAHITAAHPETWSAPGPGCRRERLPTQGHPPAEVLKLAAHLHLSPAPAKTHVSHLLTKLGARDRAQLVIARPTR